MVDSKICTGCGECTAMCPVEAIKMVNGKAVIDPELCLKCGICEGTCAATAIKIQ